MAEERPDPETITTAAELRRWYWQKDELVPLARYHGVKTTGGKFTILDRVAYFLETGDRKFPGDVKAKITSKFDWHSAVLRPETIITDSYKNTQNVRRFFQAHVNPNFKFNIAMMDWMKANCGKTLSDAIEAYLTLTQQARAPGYQTRIRDHNQFNQYTRDFLAANPAATLDEVRRVWTLKRALPMDDGRHRYDPRDLDLT